MTYKINNKTEIVFAHEGENNAREIRFDVSGYPDGIIYLELLRYGDSYAYPITLDRDGNEAVWIPDSTATAKRGTGRGQLVVMADDEVVYKSDVFKAINRYSLSTTDEIPDGYDSWLQRLEALGAVIEGKTVDGLNAINEAKDSAVSEVETRRTEAVNTVNAAKNDGINRLNDRIESGKAEINTAKTTALSSIEQKKEAVHTELDGYVEAHHDELKGDKGDAYIITEADKQQIARDVEQNYTEELSDVKKDLNDLALLVDDEGYICLGGLYE